jgi:hypothetical protein
VNLLFVSPTNHTDVFDLHVFPAKGVAVVATYEGSTNSGSERSVSYASRSRPRRSTTPSI